MEATAPPEHRIEIGGVLGETLSIYAKHWRVLLLTALGVFMVAGALSGVLRAADSVLLVLLGVAVQLAAEALYTGFVVELVRRIRARRRKHSVADLVSSASGAIGSLIANGILKGLAVAVGFVFLIAPGLFLLTIWAVTAPAIVAERRGAIEAFGRSRELVRGQGWSVFGVILIVFLIGVLIGGIAAGAGIAVGDTGQVFFGAIASIVAAPISALAASILFFDLGGTTAPAPPPVEEPAAEAPAPPGEQPPPTGEPPPRPDEHPPIQ
jgi:stage V sporulation protein SpoVS